MSSRPERVYVTGPVTRWLRGAVVLATAAVTVVVLLRYPSLPERIPTHFGVSGDIDSWGPKWTVLALAALFVVLIGAVAWLSTKPRWFNYPVEVTEANAQGLYRESERMMVQLAAALVVLDVAVMRSTEQADESVLLYIGLALMVLAVVVGIVRTVRVARRSTGGSAGSA